MTRSYIYYNLVERRLLEKYALAAPDKLIYTRNKDPTGRFKGMFEEGERKGRRAIDPKLLAEIKQSSLQDLSTQLLALLDTVKDKKVLLHGVQLAMDELNKSQVEDQNTPPDFPKMTEKENQLNYAALANCQKAGTTLSEGISASISNCTRLHTVAEKMIEWCWLPKLGYIGAPRPIEQILAKL